MDVTSGQPVMSPIQYVRGVGPKLASVLAKKGIYTLEDALYFIPRTYEDRRHISPIAKLRPLVTATVLAKVVRNRNQRSPKQTRFEVVVSDGTGELDLFWFHSYPSLREELVPGTLVRAHGEVRLSPHRSLAIYHPDFERVVEFEEGKPKTTLNFGRIVPIYSETDGLHQKTVRRIMTEVIRQTYPHLTDPLPQEMRDRLRLTHLRESFVSVHFPKESPTDGTHSPSLRRIIFEEFFVLQLGLALRKKRALSQRARPFVDRNRIVERFLAQLPFALTDDQEHILKEVLSDVTRKTAMSRLIQGDVGSGKTVVALAAAALAADNGFQTAILAPTEILAQQHYRTADQWLSPLGIRTTLVVHGHAHGPSGLPGIADGTTQVMVGTHALFQRSVEFTRLGLVVVDEQHRFGVEQRGELVRKAREFIPHLLMMTATPIPRTLALTLYGDLDISILRQKPAGRERVLTTLLRDNQRPKLYQKIRDYVKRGEQVYLIYPLIENSEKLDLKSATEMYDRLRCEAFPDFSMSLLHGRMKSEEKDRILCAFRDGACRLLVATTVIEVGIDVPNATLMVIEHPERLGLSQLHQLRGRVGRGTRQSECVLVAGRGVTERLKVMLHTDDGFEIAEEDLKLRGPGEFLGTRQHGLPGFRVGHILRDVGLLQLARDETLRILGRDPELLLPEHAGIRRMVEGRWKEKFERLRGG